MGSPKLYLQFLPLAGEMAFIDRLLGRSASGARLVDEAQRLAPVLSQILANVAAGVAPGMTTVAISDQIDAALRAAALEPVMKGYRGFPASATVSVDEQIIHAIPSVRRVANGDLLKIQTAGCGREAMVAQGWTFGVGHISAESAELLATTSHALHAAVTVIRAGARIGDIGAAIQGTVEEAGFAVIRQFVGNGIGRMLHEEPAIPGYGVRGRGARLNIGQMLHVQVILKAGSPEVRIADDGWTVLGADGRRGAIKTCMVQVEENGARLLGRFLDSAS